MTNQSWLRRLLWRQTPSFRRRRQLIDATLAAFADRPEQRVPQQVRWFLLGVAVGDPDLTLRVERGVMANDLVAMVTERQEFDKRQEQLLRDTVQKLQKERKRDGNETF